MLGVLSVTRRIADFQRSLMVQTPNEIWSGCLLTRSLTWWASAISRVVTGRGRRALPALLLIGVIETGDQTGGVPTLAAHLLHFGIELIDDCRNGQACAIAAGF
jgi:hypothetical protein